MKNGSYVTNGMCMNFLFSGSFEVWRHFPSSGSGRTSPSTSPLSSRVTAESQCDLPAPSEHPHLRGANREGAAISAYHDQQYEGVDCHELIIQLNETEILHEQADIIHYLVITK